MADTFSTAAVSSDAQSAKETQLHHLALAFIEANAGCGVVAVRLKPDTTAVFRTLLPSGVDVLGRRCRVASVVSAFSGPRDAIATHRIRNDLCAGPMETVRAASCDERITFSLSRVAANGAPRRARRRGP
jgi:hypothetical protein